jgi:hypothetical protein
MVNALSPSAYSRLFNDPELTQGFAPAATESEGRGEPETVVPVAAFLAHESCPVTGEMFSSSGTNVGRVMLAASPGHTQENMTVEAIRDNWGSIYTIKDLKFPISAREIVDLGASGASDAGASNLSRLRAPMPCRELVPSLKECKCPPN